MILQERDAKILESLRQNKTRRQMTAEHRISPRTTSKVVKQFKEKSIIEEISRGQYKVLIDTYEISLNKVLPKTRKHARSKSNVTEDQAALIKRFYRKVPRSQIAKTLKVGKVQLNMMIIEMGLGS